MSVAEKYRQQAATNGTNKTLIPEPRRFAPGRHPIMNPPYNR